MLKNTENSYGSMARFLHWVMGLGYIVMLIIGLRMVGLPNGDDKWFVYGIHKSTGLLILGFLVYRIYWRLTNPVPKLPKGLPNFIEWASRQNIRLLYVLMVLLPLSGVTMSLLGGHPVPFYNLFTIPALSEMKTISSSAHSAHVYGAYVLIGILILHISAALVHHFFFKDNVLRRMIRGS